MRYIQSFSTSGTEHEAIDQGLLGIPYIAYIEDGQYIDWYEQAPPEPTPIPYRERPLTFEFLGDGEVVFGAVTASTKTLPTVDVNVYKNGEFLMAMHEDSGNMTTYRISASTGDIFEFYGPSDSENFKMGNGNSMSETGSYTSSYNTFSGTTGWLNIYGNILSIIWSNSYALHDNIPEDLDRNGLFTGLFRGMTGLTSAENLFIPRGNNDSCFTNMFKNDTNLRIAPNFMEEYPAGTWEYGSIFYGASAISEVVMNFAVPSISYGIWNTMFGGSSSYRVNNPFGHFYCNTAVTNIDDLISSGIDIEALTDWFCSPIEGFRDNRVNIESGASQDNIARWFFPEQVSSITFTISGSGVENVRLTSGGVMYDSAENSGGTIRGTILAEWTDMDGNTHSSTLTYRKWGEVFDGVNLKQWAYSHGNSDTIGRTIYVSTTIPYNTGSSPMYMMRIPSNTTGEPTGANYAVRFARNSTVPYIHRRNGPSTYTSLEYYYTETLTINGGTYRVYEFPYDMYLTYISRWGGNGRDGAIYIDG